MGLPGTEVEVRESGTKSGVKAFIKFPFSLYAGDPCYIPQLVRDLKLTFPPGIFFKAGGSKIFYGF